MALDRSNQLWLATYDGLVRYQGFDFQHFNRANTPELAGNRFARVFSAPGDVGGVMVQLEDGRIGHLGENGYQVLSAADLDRAVPFNDKLWFICSGRRLLRSWDPDSGISTYDAAPFSAIATDHYGERLLIGTADGRVFELTDADDQPRLLLHIDSDRLVGLASGPEAELLVVAAQSLLQFGPSDGGLTLVHRLDLDQLQPRPIRAAWTERGWLLANLFSSTGFGPHMVSGSLVTPLPVPHATSPTADRSPVRIEWIDSVGRRWINDGLNLWRDGLLKYRAEERIVDFVVDPFDQIWLAQPRSGVRLLKQTAIEMHGASPGELADPNITFVSTLDDAILVGSWVELAQFEPATGRWTRLLDRAIRDVLPDSTGLLIAGHGLCLLEQPGSCRPIDDFPVPTDEVLLLHRDLEGVVWAGTDAGLFRRAGDSSWQQQAVHSATVRTALEDDAGRLIFGTNGHGLLVYRRDHGSTSPDRVIGLEQGLSSEFVRSLLHLDDGSVLVGTEDAGICLLDSGLNVDGCISQTAGLPHHSAHYLILDDDNRLWVNTNGGIYWVDVDALQAFLRGSVSITPDFYRLGQRHGLTSIEGNGGVYRAGARTADGRIWFPNQMGLVSIRPLVGRSVEQQSLATQLRVLNPAADESLHLSRHARHLEVELTAIALAEPENVQFRYRFSGEEAWNEVGHRRNLNFRDLKPGRHTLEVSSRYVNTPWPDAAQTLSFSAGYRLHEHPLLHGFGAFAGLLLMFAFWRVGQLRERRLEEEIQDRSRRLTIATEQVSSLSDAFRKVDIQHRTALQAVSRELKSALSAAMEPLMQQTKRTKKLRNLDVVRARTRTLEAMLEQVGTFTDSGQGSEEVADNAALTQSEQPAARIAQGDDRGSDEVSLLAQIRLEVLLHLADPDFSVDRLAHRLGMSRSVLYRQIKEFTQSSPAELIREIRLEEAINQLRETDHQVSCIAYATGFRSVSAFSRVFNRKMGMSPRQWRQQLAEQGS